MALWQRGRVNLTWSEAHQLHGLEVVMRRQPFGEIIDEWLAEGDDRRDWDELSPKERAVRSQKNAAEVGALIVSWNLADDDGLPVTPSVENLLAHCDSSMINDMREAYTAATARVAPPLPPSSDDGPPGEWDLPPQETLAD